MRPQPLQSFESRSAEQTQGFGKRFVESLRGGEVVFLRGDLGVGKTQFVQGIARGLGIGEAVLSPTFTFAVHYRGRLPLIHYDLYRLERQEDLEEIGFLESDDGQTVHVVEWGDRTVAPPGTILVDFRMGQGDVRHIEVAVLSGGKVS